MSKPVLVVMAAGIGSRYGGLKQIDPVDEYGSMIMDFSIYDARAAGFEKVVFIIKREDEADFHAAIGARISRRMEIAYVYQDLENLPAGFQLPRGRTKPWGTGHALMCCLGKVDGPMAVINADDFYGRHAFQMAYDFLSANEDAADAYSYMMVGYQIENTLTENGKVARGICEIDERQYLRDVRERTHIERRQDQVAYTEDGGKTWVPVPTGTTVSLNMWGFSASILRELSDHFRVFLEAELEKDPLNAEFFLPSVVDELLREKKATVKVMQSVDQWYGVTYRQDKPVLMAALQKMKDEGIYPQNLWE